MRTKLVTRSWWAALALAGAMMAAPAFGEDVTCKEDGGATYKLSFNWTTEKADIAVKSGNSWKKLYKGATAVRNNAQDKAFLAEGAVANWIGGNGGASCGQALEILFFDVAVKNGKREGTLEHTPYWSVKGQNCKPKAPAPDSSGHTVRITCT